MKKTTSEQKEQIELGKKLQAFYESGYVNKKQALLFSFYKGLATGFGAFLGGTILVGIVLGILSRFDQLPFIDHIINAINK